MFIVTGRLHIRSIWPAIAAGLVALLIVVMGASQSVFAIARGYETKDNNLQVGMVAVLSTEGSSTVERATQANVKRAVGVVTTFDASSVTLASGQAKVLVESEGQVLAYISDLGGEVKQGDILVMSPLKGVLMKAADQNASQVIAIAAEDGKTTGDDTQSHTVEYNGAQKETKIAKSKVNLNHQGVGNENAFQNEPSTLAKLGKAIVGKEVGAARVLAALIIFIIVLIAEGGIIYGAVTSSITALGRNPLARKAIQRQIAQVLIVAVGVLIVGLGAVYGILWF